MFSGVLSVKSYKYYKVAPKIILHLLQTWRLYSSSSRDSTNWYTPQAPTSNKFVSIKYLGVPRDLLAFAISAAVMTALFFYHFHKQFSTCLNTPSLINKKKSYAYNYDPLMHKSQNAFLKLRIKTLWAKQCFEWFVLNRSHQNKNKKLRPLR